MFERFTDSARRAVATAGQIAGYRRQEEIGTDHLLWGIVAAVGQDLAPAAGDVILRLGADPRSIRDLILANFEEGKESSPGHIPFTPNVKAALERAITAADVLGSNHVGAEHLLAGLAGDPGSSAGRVLAPMGFTETAVRDAITDAGSPSATAARTTVVYLPVGKSIFKNGGRIYPDLASALAAHPDQDIAPFPLVLATGEYFDLILGHYRPVGAFASYSDAYAAAKSFRETQGVATTIRIQSPSVTEHIGKDATGRDVVLGRSVKYEQVSIMTRVVSPTLHPAKAR